MNDSTQKPFLGEPKTSFIASGLVGLALALTNGNSSTQKPDVLPPPPTHVFHQPPETPSPTIRLQEISTGVPANEQKRNP